MNYYDSMQALIGNTPLVRLGNIVKAEGVNVFAKLELYNPSGSVKDRTGLYMINDAEQKGLLKKGGTIVEATAGNTGLGIAFAALNRGYRIIFVVPTKFSAEKQSLLRALGAQVINTPREEGMLLLRLRRSNLRYLIRFPLNSSRIRAIPSPTMKQQEKKFLRGLTETLTMLLQAQEAAALTQEYSAISRSAIPKPKASSPIPSAQLWAAVNTATTTLKASETISLPKLWICLWWMMSSRSTMKNHLPPPDFLLLLRVSLQVLLPVRQWRQFRNL